MKTRIELNDDLETLNEQRLCQEQYDIELYNCEREYLCSKEYGRLYKYLVEYSGFEAGPYDLSCTGIYEDEYDDDQRLLLEKIDFQGELEEEFYDEYYLCKLDILHALRSNDPDDKFISYSYLTGYYISSRNCYCNDPPNYRLRFHYNWTIQDLKDYLYEREHDEAYINRLRYERLEELLNSEFKYDLETLNEQQLFQESYDNEMHNWEREN